MMKNARIRLVSLLALVIATALSSGPARADSQPAAVARELERARALASQGDQRNACKAYSRASELAQGKSAPSLIGVSHCYTQIKDGDKAVTTARQALAVAATPEERTEATTTLGNALLQQSDEKAWTDAAALFKEEVASSSGTLGSEGLLSAMLALHRDSEAEGLLQSIRKQGKSADEIQQIFCGVNIGSRSDDARQIDDRNARLRRLDPEAPLQIGGKVSRPEIRHATKPEMPGDALGHSRDLGAVIVQTVVDTQGQVRSTRVLQGKPYGLTESALKAVKTWTFKPATLDGAPVPVCYVLTVNFKVG
jgi:TonB family protein